MARDSLSEGEHPDLFWSSLAATQFFNKYCTAVEVSDSMFTKFNENISDCNYFKVDALTWVNEVDDTLIFMHVSIQFLPKNFDSLHELIVSLHFTLLIVFVSESRIKNQTLANLSLPNYSFVHVDSITNSGGVAVYIHENLDCEICHKQHVLCNAEGLWLRTRHSTSKLTLGVIYRHLKLSTAQDFINDLAQCLEFVNKSREIYYLLGDINIDINPSSKNLFFFAKDYTTMLLSNGAISLVTKPNRVTDKTATIIDHIVTNDFKHQIFSGVLDFCDINDHYPIICKIAAPPIVKKAKEPIVLYRAKSKLDINLFNFDLSVALQEYFSSLSPISKKNYNSIFNGFVQIVSSVNKHAPLKKCSRRQRKLMRKPWITKGILISIRKKNSMFKSHFVNGNETQKNVLLIRICLK